MKKYSVSMSKWACFDVEANSLEEAISVVDRMGAREINKLSSGWGLDGQGSSAISRVFTDTQWREAPDDYYYEQAQHAMPYLLAEWKEALLNGSPDIGVKAASLLKAQKEIKDFEEKLEKRCAALAKRQARATATQGSSEAAR